jgi:hypothetical protein
LPPDTGVTEITLSVTVLDIPARVTESYTQVLPTAIGNGTEFEDTADVEPLPEPPELPEPVLDDELPAAPLLELPPPGELPGDVLQAASTRPAATAKVAAVQARPRAEQVDRFMSLTSIVY